MDLDIRQSFLSSEDVHHDENEREENRTKEKQACVGILCHLISWWAKWLVDIVVASTTWIGRGLSCVCAQQRDNNDRIVVDLTPIQEERLQRLKCRVETTFDPKREDHQEALKALWYAAFPGREFHGLISEQWKDMGWQGKDPSTDFRGAGFISLENLLFFAKTYPKSFQRLLQKQQGNRATWEYPFAVAGVNITFMLIQMLDLRSKKPGTSMGAIFLKMLAGTNTRAELLGLWATLSLAAQWSLDDLHVLGDSKVILDWISNNCKLKSIHLEGWMQQTRTLSKCFSNLNFQHVPRSLNRAADALSKRALTAVIGRLSIYHCDREIESPITTLNIFE